MKTASVPFSPGLIVAILGMILRPLIPWLKTEAKKSESPVDDWMIELLELLFPA